MSDNKVTLDQLDNSAVEAMSSSVGDVSMLNTENKTIVGALAEIVGKKEIANAIGEPLAETDKFTEMSSEINGLLSTFKTNMMNAGVVVESGDKFKALIDKIQGLTEGEGNKGIQMASGVVDSSELIDRTLRYMYTVINATGSTNNASTALCPCFNTEELGFEPTIVLIHTTTEKSEYYGLYNKFEGSDCIYGGKYWDQGNSKYWYLCSWYLNVDEVEPLAIPVKYDSGTNVIIRYHALGVGEEDTTLRDSLADILENKGVDTTEEDDMASLISKVNSLKVQSDIPFAGSGETLYTQESTSSHKNNTYSLAFSYIHTGKSGSVRVYFMLYSSGYNVYAEIVKKSGGVTTQLKEFNTVSSSICSLDVDINTGDEIIVNGRCISTAGTCDIYDGTITCNYRIL